MILDPPRDRCAPRTARRDGVVPGEIATHVTGLQGSIVFDGAFAV
ncbi:MAG TPA: hypothetical protein VJR91_17665 [Burkholderia sp.]|nr:hypothetical protein [Burkholderia sp.]